MVRHRYTAERLKKTENVVEKYKKKLEESAGLRREFKVSWRIPLVA
jgi:protein HOOK3